MRKEISILISKAIENLKKNKIIEAENIIKKTLILDKANFESLNLMGVIMVMQNSHIKAKEFFKESLKINPKNILTNFNLAKTLSELSEHHEAIIYYKKAMQLDKNYHDAVCGYGMSLFKLNKFTEALEAYNNALNINPSSIVCLINKAILLNKIKKNQEAIICCDEVLKINLNTYAAWYNKIIYLFELDLYEDAINCFEKAKKLKIIDAIKDFKIFLMLAIAYCKLGKYFDADINFNIALKINPNSSEIKYNLAFLQLISGKFTDGLENYEHRLNLPHLDLLTFKNKNSESSDSINFQELKYNTLPKLINLSDLRGKTLLIIDEQGYGDFIQFSRYIYKLLEYNPRQIILEVKKSLRNFTAIQFGSPIKIIEIGSFVKENVDFKIELLSLPHLFKTTLDSIPYSNKYFNIPKISFSKWEDILNINKNQINIGIACSGSPKNTLDSTRSIDLEKFEVLTKYANLFLLQNSINQNDQKFLNSKKSLIKFIGKDINCFTDLAAIIQNMNLVISIDTVFIHLAGSLGKKAYLLLSGYHDWRWLLDINYSPWYNSLNLYRKKNNEINWDRIFNNIIEDLKNIQI
jgi:tetratricopeptide (TPR) repeat protein